MREETPNFVTAPIVGLPPRGIACESGMSGTLEVCLKGGVASDPAGFERACGARTPVWRRRVRSREFTVNVQSTSARNRASYKVTGGIAARLIFALLSPSVGGYAFSSYRR